MKILDNAQSAWQRSSPYRKRFGTARGLSLWWATRRSYKLPAGSIFELAVPGLPARVSLRAGTSDIGTFAQIVFEGETDFELESPPTLIIDGGANIGLFSIMLAAKYPKCRILAVEVEADNYRLLCMNAAKYTNIVPLQYAIWRSSGFVRIVNPTGAANVFRVEEADPADVGAVASVSINKLIVEFAVTEISLLKLDIEGAELEVLQDESAPQWVAATRAMAIELHDSFKPGCGAALDKLLTDHKYYRSRVGEFHFFRFT